MNEILEISDIAPAWSAHLCGLPVLITNGSHQLVSYYDDTLHLAAALRTLPDGEWSFFRTDVRSDWNTSSHHAIAAGFDRDGNIHLSGAMHNQPLNYWRTTRPFDLSSFERVDTMVGENETSVTYPQFFTDREGKLYFTFRDGMSGNGNQYINYWDLPARTWRRLPRLTDGTATGASAYFHNSRPILGPDGYMHVEFVWRASIMAESCFNLCYMRSKDMLHWENAAGKELTLPVTPETKDVIVEELPQKSGLTNMVHTIGFDGQDRPVITYHKYSHDKSALFNARFTGHSWDIVKAVELEKKWEFYGAGAIPHMFEISPVFYEGGELCLLLHSESKCQRILLDSSSLLPLSTGEISPPWKGEAQMPASSFTLYPMSVEWIKDKSSSREGAYYLRWEHGPNNSDSALPPPHPKAEMLRVYKLSRDFIWRTEIH